MPKFRIIYDATVSIDVEALDEDDAYENAVSGAYAFENGSLNVIQDDPTIEYLDNEDRYMGDDEPLVVGFVEGVMGGKDFNGQA